MKRSLSLILILLFSVTTSVFAATKAPSFTAGKDYEEIKVTNPTNANNPSTNKVHVIEFFSYGCPWCFHLEPTLEKWLANKPKNVEFEKVPVVFESGWQVYAKAYYTAEALGILDKITPALFNGIHKQGLVLNNDQAMQEFFIKQGVKKQDFDSAFNFSPTIAMEVNQGTQMMQNYQVLEIPTFIINGKYKTSARMANGDNDRLMQIVSFLVAKSANTSK